MPDPVWPFILCGGAFFLLGALLAAAVKPFRRNLEVCVHAFLRLTRIRPDAGRETVSEEEFRALMNLSEEKGGMEADEKEMIENVFAFNDTVAEDVMVHRTDMVLVWTGDTDEEVMETIRSSGLSRFPVCKEDADDIVGILNTRDYLLNSRLFGPKPVKELLRSAYFVPESVRADVLFRDMQSKKVHMAIVVDEYGGTSGLVTMEDLLEEIVGNIYDEFDPLEDQDIIPLEENLWRISGSADLEDVGEALDIVFPEDEEYDTLGGLVFDQLSVIPGDGSRFDVVTCGLCIRVEEFSDRRVEWALVSKQTATADQEGGREK